MTTLVARRTELDAAFTAASIRFEDTWRGEPPYVVAFFDGSDLDPFLADGSSKVQLAVILVVSKALDDVSMLAVDAAVQSTYAVLRGLRGWAIDSIGAVSRNQDAAGNFMYTVTFRVSVMAELGG